MLVSGGTDNNDYSGYDWLEGGPGADDPHRRGDGNDFTSYRDFGSRRGGAFVRWHGSKAARPKAIRLKALKHLVGSKNDDVLAG